MLRTLPSDFFAEAESPDFEQEMNIPATIAAATTTVAVNFFMQLPPSLVNA